MSTTASSRIISIYKSRNTILDHLSTIGFDNAEYTGFSINEIDAMFSNNQLDMLLQNTTSGQKAYVKYYLSAKQTTRQIRPQSLDEIIEDLFAIENVLDKKDILIIIIDDEPNETIINKMKYLYDHDGIFVVIHNIQRLQFNILEHQLVPYMTIMEEEQVKELMKKYNLRDTKQLPEISRFDPQALALCVRPGQVCKTVRNSATAIHYDYYRVCV